MATHDGQPIAVGTTLRRVRVMRDGAPAAPQAIDRLSDGESIEGLELGEGESIALGSLDGHHVDARVVSVPEREVRRRGLRQALRRVRQATQAGEIAEPLDMQRIVLGLVREAFGEED